MCFPYVPLCAHHHLCAPSSYVHYIEWIIHFLENNRLPEKVIQQSCDALLTISKSFVKFHLDYGDIVYDKPNNESFTSRLERVQYKVCVAIAGAIQGTSCECLYKELGLEFLSDRRWVCKLTFFYKILKGNSTQYLQTT